MRDRLGLPDGVLCLCVGQLTERKGVDVLLDGFRLASQGRSDVYLVLIGSGRMKDELLRRVAGETDLAARILFLGHQSEDDLPRYYAACDIFVFPTRRDVWGMVLNEAMSAGLPVISSDRAGGAWDLVDDGITGYTFPSEDPKALAEKLRLLLGDESRRRRMALAAREKILSGYTPEHQANQLLQVVYRFLGQGDSTLRFPKNAGTVGI